MMPPFSSVAIHPIKWSSQRLEQLNAFETNNGNIVARKNRNAKIAGNFFEHLALAWFGGTLQDRRQVGNRPDLLGHDGVEREIKANGEAFEGQYKLSQVLRFASYEEPVDFVLFRHSFPHALSTYTGSEDELYTELAAVPKRAFIIPARTLATIAARCVSEQSPFYRLGSTSTRNSHTPLLLPKKPFFQALSVGNQLPLLAPHAERHYSLQGICLSGITLPSISVLEYSALK